MSPTRSAAPRSAAPRSAPDAPSATPTDDPSATPADAPSATLAGDRSPPPRGALVALSLAMLLPALGTSVANVALPTLAHTFDASFRDVQWVVLAYLVTVTSLVVGGGRLGDLLGRRRLLLAGIALFTVASALASAAPSLLVLVLARGLQGVGAAPMMALTLAFVGDLVPRERTGRTMGMLGAMSAAGTALGPAAGGMLLAVTGWQTLFFLNVPLGLIAWWLAARHLPRDASGTRRGARDFDVAGTLVLAVTLVAATLALTRADAVPGGALVLALVAGSGLALFARIESRATMPLVRLAMLRDATLGGGIATSFLVSTVMMATLVVGPFHLAGVLHLDALQTGLVMAIGPAVVAVAGVPAGRAADRFGSRTTIIAAFAAMTAGAATLALLANGTLGIAGYVGPLVTITAGYALFQAANNTAVMADVPRAERGLASGFLGLARNLGLAGGAAGLGALFAFASGANAVAAATPTAVAAGTRATFVAAAALLGLAMLVAAIATPRRERHDPSGSQVGLVGRER